MINDWTPSIPHVLRYDQGELGGGFLCHALCRRYAIKFQPQLAKVCPTCMRSDQVRTKSKKGSSFRWTTDILLIEKRKAPQSTEELRINLSTLLSFPSADCSTTDIAPNMWWCRVKAAWLHQALEYTPSEHSERIYIVEPKGAAWELLEFGPQAFLPSRFLKQPILILYI